MDTSTWMCKLRHPLQKLIGSFSRTVVADKLKRQPIDYLYKTTRKPAGTDHLTDNPGKWLLELHFKVAMETFRTLMTAGVSLPCLFSSKDYVGKPSKIIWASFLLSWVGSTGLDYWTHPNCKYTYSLGYFPNTTPYSSFRGQRSQMYLMSFNNYLKP